jgi:hypothetical protein
MHSLTITALPEILVALYFFVFVQNYMRANAEGPIPMYSVCRADGTHSRGI